jgi:hypothetical protein
MEIDKKIETTIVNVKSILLFISIYIFGGTLLFMLLTIKLRIISIAVAGFIIFWICPFIFQKRFRKPFSRRMDVLFGNEFISLNLYDNKSGLVNKEQIIKYDQINAFRIIDSSKDDSSFLKFSFRNGESVTYTFIGQSAFNSSQNVSENLFEYINKYNANKNELDKIAILPNLFATKLGRNLIYLLTGLLVFVVIWQLSVNPKTIPISLFGGLILYIIIFAQRKKDVELMQKLK